MIARRSPRERPAGSLFRRFRTLLLPETQAIALSSEDTGRPSLPSRREVADIVLALRDEAPAFGSTEVGAPPRPVSRFDARIDLPVTGMSDLSCASRVEKKLSDIPGVSHAAVNLETERAAVHYDRRWVTIPQLVRCVVEDGYGVATSQAILPVQGMSCASRISEVERALRDVPGVVSANVNPGTGRATVDYVRGLSCGSGLRAAIESVGYGVLEAPEEERIDREEEARKRGIRTLFARFVLSGILSGFVLLGSLEALSAFAPQWLRGVYVLWLLTTVVQFYAGWPFHRGAWAAARHRASDRNTLIALGTSAVYFYSAAAALFPDFLRGGGAEPRLYFDTTAVMITLILLGRWLEAVTQGRTSAAVEKLRGLRPETARVLRDRTASDIPTGHVRVGDRIRVRPGERVPADGVIVEGWSSLDESGVTGESLPAKKGVGDEVIGGALNKMGGFLFEARAVGAETALARIAKRVEDAQASPAPIGRKADRTAAVFVPAVIGISLVTFFVWLFLGPAPSFNFALLNLVSVLIVASPYVLGLATPSAVLVGTGRGAQSGILIRGGESLESASKIRTVAFVKRGALTEGRPEVTDLVTAHGFSADEVLRLAGSAERGSEHPLAIAVVEKARERGVPLTVAESRRDIPGQGVRATVEGRSVLLGNAGILEAEGVDTSGLRSSVEVQTEKGKTPILLAVDGVPAALLSATDPLKESAPEAIGRLHRMGLETVLLTGDHRRAAQVIGEEAGVGRVLAELSPEDKAREVLVLQGEGKRVAVVGDGAYESPALAQAEVGVSLGTGPGVAVGVSDIALIGGDPMGVLNAIRLCRRTVRTIKQNLFWAFAYNAAGISIAAGVLHPLFGTAPNPIYASLAMAFSSVFVLWNSLRLRRFRSVEFKP